MQTNWDIVDGAGRAGLRGLGLRATGCIAALLFAAGLGLAGCSGTTTAASSSPAPTPGTLAVTSASTTVAQSAGSASIAVSRSGGTSGAVSVAYSTTDITAVAGTDYTKTTGTLSWSDGDSSPKTITVALSTSPGFAGFRTFAITLSNASGASLGIATETVSIIGSGLPGTISFASATAATAQSAGSVALSVTRSGGSSGAVAVSYTTQDGTAVAGTDYTKTTGILTWNDGDAAAKSISVPISNSTAFGGSRVFGVALFSPTNGASLGTATEIVTISGNGAPGTVAIAGTAIAATQTSGGTIVTFTRTGGSYGAATASYTTADGTAVAGTDYTKTTGTVSWADGDAASKPVTIPLSKTTYFNGTKTFTVSITSNTGSAAVGNTSTTVTITGGLLPPANYFSFSGPTYTWKLQLPIDTYGGTGGTNNIQYASIEASNAQITAGFTDAYFYADTATYGGATNHVVFTAPSNGAVTTPGGGSDHTRSELRELYSGTGADSNHDWTSAIGGTLTANCVVQTVSVDSDEATIGQIHNQSYVFMLLEYRPAYKDLAVVVYSALGSSSYTRTSMVQNVNIGDAIAYSINYVGNSIAVMVNGTSKTFPVDTSWAGTPMYFKLGAYHAAPNIGNPAGDATQVAFSSFNVTH